ncbi:MAG: Gfo/Idh/MocA family oxidoreductase [Kiritimatiellae bacterium]|nr:Gfo/Idh/MocA family oxidoreductase [Kiritimatiellia bacterium]
MGKNLPIHIAILGFGGRAEGMAKYAVEHPDQLQVVAVADPQPQRRQRATALFGRQCRTYETGEEFYHSNQSQGIGVDGIWVISQERTHAELAVPALERGLPLIVEKPLATSIRDAYRICEAFDRHPVPLTVPHSLRYLASYRKVREIVASGVLGRILHIHAVEQIDHQHTVGYYRRGPGMYRSNTTFLLAKCSHDIDIIYWMMGGVRAKSVASFGGADYFKPRAELPELCSDRCPLATGCPFFGVHYAAKPYVVDKDTLAVGRGDLCAWNSGAEQVDHQTLIIQYEDGTTADFTLKCFGDNRRSLQITGSHGTVYATPTDVELVSYHPARVEKFGSDRLPVQPGTHGGGDYALIRDWIEAVVSGGQTSSATVHESAEAVAVCIGAELAMMHHKLIEMADLRRQQPGPEALLWPVTH